MLNMLVNITGQLWKWIEGDLLQEHYNCWLEDTVSKKGGDFDDQFYHQTLLPNVNHFLRIKEQIEAAFNLKAWGKGHTSPHLHSEYQWLLAMYKEDKHHLFHSSQSSAHATINYFDCGYKWLEEGRLHTYLEKSTAYADIIADSILQNGQDNMSSAVSQSNMPLQDLTQAVLTNALASPDSAPSSQSSSEIEVEDLSTLAPPSSDLDYNNNKDCSDEHLVSESEFTSFVDKDTGVLCLGWDATDLEEFGELEGDSNTTDSEPDSGKDIMASDDKTEE